MKVLERFNYLGMWLFMALFIFLGHAMAEESQDFQSASGIYVLVPGGNELEKLGRATEVEGVKGVSLAFPWDMLEPKPGEYDWSPLIKALDQLSAKGLQVMLGIAPGMTTPEWVYDKGAKEFEFVDQNPYHGKEYYPEGHRFSTYNENLKIPVPWDETFLTAWENLVAELGRKINGKPALTMVIVSGPTRHSFEMHLPKRAEDKGKWLTMGYTPGKLISAWKRSIDAFAKAFPDIPLVLHLSPAIFADGVLEAVAGYGYDTYGQRFFMQNDILVPDDGNMKRADWSVLAKYRNLTTIGFQRGLPRIKGWQKLPRTEKLKLRKEQFEKMFDKGIGLGARYFEVGAPAVNAFPEVVTRADEQLRRTLSGK
jgi:hypothetical protein